MELAIISLFFFFFCLVTASWLQSAQAGSYLVHGSAVADEWANEVEQLVDGGSAARPGSMTGLIEISIAKQQVLI